MTIKIQAFRAKGIEDLETQVNGFVNQLRGDGVKSTRHYSHNRVGAVDNYVAVIEYEEPDNLPVPAKVRDNPTDYELSIRKHTRAMEDDLIRRALTKTNGNITKAAQYLEISHRALLYKLKDYGFRS